MKSTPRRTQPSSQPSIASSLVEQVVAAYQKEMTGSICRVKCFPRCKQP